MEDDRMRGCADDETTMTSPLHCISGEEGNGHRRARGSSRQEKRFPSSRARSACGVGGANGSNREFNGAGIIICVDSSGATQRRRTR